MRQLQLTETATQYTATRNRYGDLGLAGGATVRCLYRDISRLDRNVQFSENVSIQGIFWFDPSSTVRKGTVIGYQGQLYRIENVTVAKQLVTTGSVHFIKCHASLYRSIS